jgi:manganese efflux pump family protein
MQILITSILIGISLSMDTFSISLLYGTLNLSNKKIILLSIIVAIYHFFMPLIGNLIGNIILKLLIIEPNIIISILFLLLAIEMIKSVIKEEKNLILLNIIGLLLFGFAVSIDSFSTGIGLKIITPNIPLTVSIFSVLSGIFTYIGLKLGNRLNRRYGKISSIIGGIILICLSLYYLTK